jgi:hypothetical protein
VGLVKRLVANELWPMLVGFEPTPKPMNRHEFLYRTELVTKGAEICHGATFVLVLCVALFCLAVDRVSAASWIVAFNIALNGYPVMLQRFNRSRVHQLRARRLR